MTFPSRNLLPAARIFVFGKEVSSKMTACQITYHDGKQPNLASFTLVNEDDEFIITDRDMFCFHPELDPTKIMFPELLQGLASNTTQVDQTSDSAFVRILDNIERSILSPLKADVVKAKIGKVVPINQSRLADEAATTTGGSLSKELWLQGKAQVYPYQVGDCIFHSNDQVRIFWRDPYRPELWYHMFAGFVSDWVDSVDENGVKMLTIRCEDPTRILRYARITTNPGIIDVSALKEIEDVAIRTFYNDNFFNLTLTELLYTIIFGDVVAGTSTRLGFTNTSATGESTSSKHIYGVGNFNFERSATFLFGPEARETVSITRKTEQTSPEIISKVVNLTNLGDYQSFIDHQVKVSDLDEMLDTRVSGLNNFANTLGIQTGTDLGNLLKDENGKVLISEVITAIGTQPHLYPVDGGRLIILAPKSLGPDTNRDILMRDVIKGPALQTSFKTRLSIIYDVLSRIEFSFYASPKGDILCEMPLYDFMPDDFGTTTRSSQFDINNGQLVPSESDETRGPFRECFTIPIHDTVGLERTFTDDKVRTQMSGTWQSIQGYTDTGQAIGYTKPMVRTLKALVPLFGVRTEQVEPQSFISSPQASALSLLIKLNQCNADARNSAFRIMPRLQLWVNRPHEFVARRQVATSRTVTHSLVWNSDMSTELGVNYVRGWAGQVDKRTHRPIYEPLGGFASRVVNYSTLFGLMEPIESAGTPDSAK